MLLDNTQTSEPFSKAHFLADQEFRLSFGVLNRKDKMVSRKRPVAFDRSSAVWFAKENVNMARQISKRDLSPILAAAAQWLETCLIEDHSLFLADARWTTSLVLYHFDNVPYRPR